MTATISELHMSLPKLTANQVGGYRQFQPGQPVVFDNVTVEAASTGATNTYLEAWMASVASGTQDRRNGRIVLDDEVDTVASIDLFDLLPLSFPLFPTNQEQGLRDDPSVTFRSIFLSLGRFEIGPP